MCVWITEREGMNGEVVAASAEPSPPLEWRFSQVFGERSAGEEVHEGNKNSAIDFGSLKLGF